MSSELTLRLRRPSGKRADELLFWRVSFFSATFDRIVGVIPQAFQQPNMSQRHRDADLVQLDLRENNLIESGTPMRASLVAGALCNIVRFFLFYQVIGSL